MYLRHLKLTNFRNYRSGEADLSPGINIVIGDNGAGKTNLLEAAQYGLCGRSFRTTREAEMIGEGSDFFRLEVEVESGGVRRPRAVSFGRGGTRIDSGGGPRWLPPGSVLSFSPDDLQLIKGPPAARRRFLDDAMTRRRPARHQLTTDYQKVLSQRNSFLQRARAGLVPLAEITPWDRQLAALALKIHKERRRYCENLSPLFGCAYEEISGDGAEGRARVAYRSQLDDCLAENDPEAFLLAALSEAWQRDMEKLSTSVGTHRDDVEFLLEGRSLKPYGSQGEQRTAVLALLLASRRLGRDDGGPQPLLLLDDVMSELDPERRRRLMGALGAAGDPNGLAPGQVIVTAADRSLFGDEETAASAVLEVREGVLEEARTGTGA